MPRTKGLDPIKLDAVRVFVEMYSSQNEQPPSVREIMDGCGFVSSSTTHRYLKRLVEHGQIEYHPNRPYRKFTVPGARFYTAGSLHIDFPEISVQEWEDMVWEIKEILVGYFPEDHKALWHWNRRLKDPREVVPLAREVVTRAVNFEESFGKRNAGIKSKRV